MQIDLPSLPKAAAGIVSYLQSNGQADDASVLALSGDLGAGKTTLVQQIAYVLGVQEFVPSPTFVIMRTYATSHSRFKKLVHIDAYRIESSDELPPLRLGEVFAEAGTLVCIEWPERLAEVLPKKALPVNLVSIGEGERELTGDPGLEGYLQNTLKVV